MAAYPDVENGIGTTFNFWIKSRVSGKRQFPMTVVTARHSGITTVSIDTTHLMSEEPVGREFGGRTSIPGRLRNPGQVTMEGFLNPQTVLPQKEFFLEIVFPYAHKYKTRARWVGYGHLQSIGDIVIAIDDAIKQTLIFQYSGKVSMIAAKR